MRTTNFTDLRTNLKHHLDSVVQDNTPLIVQRPNGESVVVISLEDYNSIIETEYLLSNPANVEHLREESPRPIMGKLLRLILKTYGNKIY